MIKSSYSASTACVEVGTPINQGLPEGYVLVRDSKDKTGDGHVLQFSPLDWETKVLDPIRNGDFNWDTFRPLQFNDGERRAFVLGVLDREFDLKKEKV